LTRLARKPARAGAEAGFALLVVLWSLVLISLIVTQLMSDGRLEAQRIANGRIGVTGQAAVDGAIDEALFHLLDQSEHHWAADGAPHDIWIGGVRVTVVATNEADKVNPNIAPKELMSALLHRVGVAQREAVQIANAIENWRTQAGDSNDQAAAYRAMGYLPPGTPFQSVEEIALVAGVTPDLLIRLMPHLQVYRALLPRSSGIDPVVVAALADWSGLPPSTSGSGTDETFVALSAVASGRGDARASRQAVVQLEPAAKDSPFHVLAWQ
jgi:general secretion pathway protein K